MDLPQRGRAPAATGRDARGRKQYRYHPRFRQAREETKYEKMLDFAKALPKIRARCERDLALPGIPRAKVLAAVVQLLEQTFIRIGNEEYTRLNKSFGLTTLRDKHARIRGSSVNFHFRGKSGKDRSVTICDKRLARIVKRCQDLPGEILFQYLDDKGEIHSIGSADVNEYLRETAGAEFTAKDFRTWNGTLLAALGSRVLPRRAHSAPPHCGERASNQGERDLASRGTGVGGISKAGASCDRASSRGQVGWAPDQRSEARRIGATLYGLCTRFVSSAPALSRAP